MRRVAAASREDSAVRRFLVGGSWTVSFKSPRFWGRKMAGIGSPSSRAGERGGEGRLAGSSRSDEMASARTRSVDSSLVLTGSSKGEDDGGVGGLCPRDACALEATNNISVIRGLPLLAGLSTSTPTSKPKGDYGCAVFHHATCSSGRYANSTRSK